MGERRRRRRGLFLFFLRIPFSYVTHRIDGEHDSEEEEEVADWSWMDGGREEVHKFQENALVA